VADAELVRMILERCPAGPGPEWDALAKALAEYAFPVLRRWIVTGEIRRKAAEAVGGKPVLGLGRLPEQLRLPDGEADTLAVEIVTASLRSFRARLPVWDPDGGASLKVYFVTWCLMQLPDAYGRWYRREARPQARVVQLDEVSEAADTDPGPEVVVVADDHLASLTRSDPSLRRILVLRLDGFTVREIAKILADEGTPMTEGQVRRKLRDLRRRRPG
jgi:hypothetical protein